MTTSRTSDQTKLRHLSLVPKREMSEIPLDSTPLASLSDEALVAEFHAGRDNAFDVLYIRYRDKMLAFLRGMIKNPALAEEVYNSTMYRVYARLPVGLEPGRFRRYLYRAAINASINAGRRESNLLRRPPAGRSWGGSLSDAFQHANPEERLSDAELIRLVTDHLDKLPEDRRSALLLYHQEGMTYQDIAEVMGRPIGTIRWLIHEARMDMARVLQRHIEEQR